MAARAYRDRVRWPRLYAEGSRFEWQGQRVSAFLASYDQTRDCLVLVLPLPSAASIRDMGLSVLQAARTLVPGWGAGAR